jgi:hypothetical protein
MYQGAFNDPVPNTVAALKLSMTPAAGLATTVIGARISGSASANVDTYAGYFSNISTVSGTGLAYGIFATGAFHNFGGETRFYQGTFNDPVVGTAASVKISATPVASTPTSVFTVGITGAATANNNTFAGYFTNTSTVSGTGINYGVYAIGTYHFLSGNVGIGMATPSGSRLTVNGNVWATSFTGSLLGTATTASYATYAMTASIADVSVTASRAINANTASYVQNAASASYAFTSSYAATASFSRDFTVGSTLVIDQTLTDYASIAASSVGSNNLFTQNTGSYTSAFFKYTCASASFAARAGEVIAVWNGTSVQFTDFSTVDFGNTSPVTASVAIVTGQVQLNMQTNTSGWTIKSMATFI